MNVGEFFNKVGFKVNDGDVKKVNNAISGIKKTATKVLGAIGIGFSLSNMNALIEEFDAVNDGIRNSISGLEDAGEAQRKILEAANGAKASYKDMAGTVSNLAKSNEDLFPLDDAIAFSSNMTKLLKTAGRSESEISSVMEGMNKSFQKGIVDSETLNKLLEKAPEGANILAEHLGVAKSELLKMASDGKMSVNDLKAAFMEAGDDIDSKFQQLNFGVSDAILNIRNKWGFWLKETDEMLGLTQTIGKTMVGAFDKVMGVLNRVRNGIVWLTQKLGGAERVMKLLGIVMAEVVGAKAIKGVMKLVDGFKGLDKASLSSYLRIAKIALAIGLVALLVEDFINFMQGNDSVIGELLGNAGVDVDKFRENIIKIWGNIKTVLGAVWKGIKNVAIPIFQSIWKVIKDVFGFIGSLIEKIAPQLEGFVDDLANGDVDTDKWEKFGETLGKIAAVVIGLVAAFKTFKAIMAVVNAVQKAYAVVQGIVNAVMSANPVFLIIAGIVALIAVIVLCIKHWDKIKAAVLAVWEAIKNAFGAVASWFDEHVIQPIVGFFTGLWDKITGIFEGIRDTIGDVFGAVVDIVKAPINGIIGFLNKLIDALNGLSFETPDWLPFGLGGKKFGFNIPNIPALAQGGYVKANSPRLAMIGDNPTQGEIVAPENKLMSIMMQALNAFVAKLLPSTASGANVSTTQNRSVVQNVEINNQFTGDAPVQQKASKAMDKASKDATGEMARALKYA